MQNIGGAFGSAVLATVVSLSIQGKAPTIPLMTTVYHDGFMLALVLSLVLLIPSLFLTNKKSKKKYISNEMSVIKTQGGGALATKYSGILDMRPFLKAHWFLG